MNNPQPKAWPACPTCDTAYVLRRAIVMRTEGKRATMGEEWVWQRDCKHKKAEPVVKTSTLKRATFANVKLTKKS